MKRMMYRGQWAAGGEEAGKQKLAEARQRARQLVKDGEVMTFAAY